MPSPDLYFDTIFAFQRSAALKSAIELDVFTAIGDGARTAREIAKACGAPERGIRILCDRLTIIGFVTKAGDAYELTADSQPSSRSVRLPISAALPRFSTQRRSPVTSMISPRQFGGGTPRVSLVADENPAWTQFARAMVPMMMPSAQAMADILDVASAGPMRVLDIAAGHGIFGIVIAQRNAAAEIVAVDWAPVLAVAAENAKAMGVGARHRTVTGDAFTVDCGTGFDLALVTNFLHHFDRPNNVALLKKIAEAMKSGGRVVLLEFVPNEDRVTPPMAAGFSLVMLACTASGDAYTFRELSGMLSEAGFKGVTAHPPQGAQTAIVATK